MTTMYSSMDEMWTATLGELVTRRGNVQASRAGDTSEVLAWAGGLKNLDRTLVLNPERGFSAAYGCVETLWYLSGESRVDRVVPYAPSYWKYANSGVAYGAYGARWRNNPGFVQEKQDYPGSQLSKVIELLRAKPETRQAIVTMWDSGDVVHAMDGDRNDIPCTLTWQFLSRGGHLHMIVTMRSNDCWLGLPYDVFVNTTIQRLIAYATGLDVGTYVHQSGSMHLYAKQFDQAVRALMPAAQEDARTRSFRYTHVGTLATRDEGWTSCRWPSFDAAVAAALRFEETARLTGEADLGGLEAAVGKHNPLWDAALVCASKFAPVPHDLVSSPLMREAAFGR